MEGFEPNYRGSASLFLSGQIVNILLVATGSRLHLLNSANVKKKKTAMDGAETKGRGWMPINFT